MVINSLLWTFSTFEEFRSTQYSAMANPKPNQLITCPFNPSHQVEHYRLHYHLSKCWKQHSKAPYNTCPFDWSHVCNESELDYHVSTCLQRYMIDVETYVVDDDKKPVVDVQPPTTVVQCSENWDDDNAASYVPDVTKKAPHIIIKVRGGTRTERKKARMEGIKNYRPPPTN